MEKHMMKNVSVLKTMFVRTHSSTDSECRVVKNYRAVLTHSLLVKPSVSLMEKTFVSKPSIVFIIASFYHRSSNLKFS